MVVWISVQIVEKYRIKNESVSEGYMLLSICDL